MVDVTGLDPSLTAPTIVVDRDPRSDQVGHGRTLPLIGNARPHVYDVMFDDGRKRVYADTAAHALTAIILDYEDAGLASWQEQIDAEAMLDRGEEPTDEQTQAAADKYADAWALRYAHAHEQRIRLQQAENARAQACADWQNLSTAEREHLEDCANGMLPFGLSTMQRVPTGDIFGGPEFALVEQGVWETPYVKLVINRGDYDLFSQEGDPEPESTLGYMVTDEDGTEREVIMADLPPLNMTILDPSDDLSYLSSLAEAGVVEVTVRPVDLPDNIYTGAVELGRQIIEAHPDLGDYGTAAGLGIVGQNAHPDAHDPGDESPEHAHDGEGDPHEHTHDGEPHEHE